MTTASGVKPAIQFVRASELEEDNIIGFVCESGRLKCYLASDACQRPIWGKILYIVPHDPVSWRPTSIKAGEVWFLCGFPHGDTVTTCVKSDERVATDKSERSSFFHAACANLIQAARDAFAGPPGEFKPPWEL
ncbi:hypothetical protein [Nonomuraea sp. B19D2]|uniref:hypothetical protein n=1 Tax=Nonomuraea sp. B19D2 TaxID=3159561 RepID=UPI0032DAEEA7